MRFNSLIILLLLLIISNTTFAAVKIASYSFDETNWATDTKVLDSIGGHNGAVNGPINRNNSDSVFAHPNTCASASFGGGSIDISGLPVSTVAGDKTTLSFWMYWDGKNSVMPVGWNVHDLWFYGGSFGFNSGAGDIYGISSAGLANGWHHVIAEFTNKNIHGNKIYIDGAEQVLTQRRNAPNNARAVVQSSLRLGGWFISTGYRFSGYLDEVKVYNGALTPAEVNADYKYAHVGVCPADPIPEPAKLIASYNFNDDWSAASPLVDSVGTAHGTVSGSISRILSPTEGNKPETCAAGDFNGGAIDILKLPVSTKSGDKTSISFWMNWNGTSSVMPIGWKIHDLYFSNGGFGFNSGGGDVYGFASDTLKNTWRHITVVFTNNNMYGNKIYVDGIEQTLSLRRGTVSNSRAVVSQHLRIGGWTHTPGYRFRGQLDEIKIYTGEISQEKIDTDRKAISACHTPVAEYRFDGANWNEKDFDVTDSTINANHGQVYRDSAKVDIPQSEPGKICSAIRFNGKNRVQIKSNPILDAIGKENADYSVSFWVKLDNPPNSNSWRNLTHKGNINYERTYAAWLRPSKDNRIHHRVTTTKSNNEGSDSKTAVPLNNWTFITLVKKGNLHQTYINSILTANIKLSGLTKANNGPLYIGDDPWYDGINGLFDEYLIFHSGLSQSDITAMYANYNANKNWDGTLRKCVTPAIDHFEITYPVNSLTCTSSSLTIKACANTDCSKLYESEVDLTLEPNKGWLKNPITMTKGILELDLSHTIAETIKLDISSSSIKPEKTLQCFKKGAKKPDPKCSLEFSDAGFEFELPTLTACKPSDKAIIRAVKKSDTGVKCVGALIGNQPISFWSTFVSPLKGTKAVGINGNKIKASSPGTTVNLEFDINGEATFIAQYDDAGQVQLNAKFVSKKDLVLAGDGTFISKPVMLTAFSDAASAECKGGDASCSKFKKAGEAFNLQVNAACWTHDKDKDYTDNPVTPNFELIDIKVAHVLVAPAAGVIGTRAVSNFNFVTKDGGSHSIKQSLSEVGVFSFSLNVPEYFGEKLSVVNSPNIGRFYPDHFKATTDTDGSFGAHACSGFSYSGQAFTYQIKPKLNVTAYNAAKPAAITQNYRDKFAMLKFTDFSVTTPTSDASQLGKDTVNLVRLNWIADASSLADNSDGSHTFLFGHDRYVYLHEPNSLVSPFNNAVDLVFTSIADSDGVKTENLPYILQPRGEPIRFGRLNLFSAHGSELAPLPVSIKTEYFNGVNWVDNTLDQCTNLNLASRVRLANAETSGGSFVSGSSTMNITSGATSGSLSNSSPLLNGEATLTFSAPGEGNQGYVNIKSQISGSYSWLLGDYDHDGIYDDEASARASFGLFKGSDTIIFRREIY
jgi:MSHA biogenesis protein MshQ